MSRAALQSPEAAQQLPEEVFWFATQPKDRLKWNLLSPGAFPWLKRILRRCVTTTCLSLQVEPAVPRCLPLAQENPEKVRNGIMSVLQCTIPLVLQGILYKQQVCVGSVVLKSLLGCLCPMGPLVMRFAQMLRRKNNSMPCMNLRPCMHCLITVHYLLPYRI